MKVAYKVIQNVICYHKQYCSQILLDNIENISKYQDSVIDFMNSISSPPSAAYMRQ